MNYELKENASSSYLKKDNIFQRCITCNKLLLNKFSTKKNVLINEIDKTVDMALDDLFGTISMSPLYKDSDKITKKM